MSELTVTIDDRVARITLNRPQVRNALSPALLEGLIDACGRIAAVNSVNVVVLSGSGSCFSAGADIGSFATALQGSEAREAADIGRRAALALAEVPQITVATIHGHCVGGGVVLAAACDLRIAAQDARFAVPELAMGIPLAWGGSALVADLVGLSVAAELILTARRFGADEAHRIGLVSNVVPADQFTGAAEELIATLAGRPTGAMRTTKQQLAALRRGDFEGRGDADALVAALRDPETQQAVQQYLMTRLGRSG